MRGGLREWVGVSLPEASAILDLGRSGRELGRFAKAFAATFNYCRRCHKDVCGSCWNTQADACRSCAAAPEAESDLGPIGSAGVLGPDGRPWDPRVALPSQLVESIRLVSGRLLQYFSDRPDEMYRLASRAFEELVAELLNREGFDVELTPNSGDGGVDIYATTTVGLGPALEGYRFLVQCKRNRPANTVGIGVVQKPLWGRDGTRGNGRGRCNDFLFQ